MDITSILELDHEKVDSLFLKLKNYEQPRSKRQMIFGELRDALEVHTLAEESIFYPAVREDKALKDLVEFSKEEHDEIRVAIENCEDLMGQIGNETNALQKLENLVKSHVISEEGSLFPAVREAWSQQKQDSLGLEFNKAKTVTKLAM